MDCGEFGLRHCIAPRDRFPMRQTCTYSSEFIGSEVEFISIPRQMIIKEGGSKVI